LGRDQADQSGEPTMNAVSTAAVIWVIVQCTASKPASVSFRSSHVLPQSAHLITQPVELMLVFWFLGSFDSKSLGLRDELDSRRPIDDRVRFVGGWFQDVLPALRDRR
jgi:hypothetical protein